MTKYKIYWIVLLLITTIAQAQNNPKAVSLLDEVSQKMDGYENMVIAFTYTLNNTEENITQQNQGLVTIKDDHYNLNFMDNTFMYNGDKTYVIVPEDEEVNVFAEESEEGVTITPSKMLFFYKEGYGYQWDSLKKIDGKEIQFVKLYPKDADTDIEHILLGVEILTKHIYKLIEQGKSGTQTTLLVTDFKPNQTLEDDVFFFDRENYLAKDYTIVEE